MAVIGAVCRVTTTGKVIYIPLVDKKARNYMFGGTSVGPAFDKGQVVNSLEECKKLAREHNLPEEKIRVLYEIEKRPKDKFGHRELDRLGLGELARAIAVNKNRKIVVLPGYLTRKVVLGKRKRRASR